MFDSITHGIRFEYFSYWLLLLAAVLIAGGSFAMKLRLQQIPRKGKWFDIPYLVAFLFFLAGALLALDFILELVDIPVLSPYRKLVEELLRGPRI